MPEQEPAIEVDHLTFSYPEAFSVKRWIKGERTGSTDALKDISFSVEPGEVLGLLGPNGAGKTTLIKILSTILVHTEGTVRILGHPLPREAAEVRGKIGLAIGEYERTFHHRLTGRANLEFFASFKGLRESSDRIDELLDRVGLGEAGERLFREYSTGMKHRLALARALLGDPELLILDEPTAGLDVHVTEELRDLIQDLVQQDRTTIYTSHRLDEVGTISDRVLILKGGRKIAEASPDELRRNYIGHDVVEARLDGSPNGLVRRVEKIDGVEEVRTPGGGKLAARVEDLDGTLPELVSALEGSSRELVDIQSRSASMEDVFVRLMNGGG